MIKQTKTNIIISLIIGSVIISGVQQVSATTYTGNELLTKLVQAENKLKWTVKNTFNKAVIIAKNLKVKGKTQLGDSTDDSIELQGTVSNGDDTTAIQVNDDVHLTGTLTLDTPLAASMVSSSGIVKGVTAGSNITVTDSGNGSYAIAATDTNTTYSAGTGIALSGTTFSSSLGTSISGTELDSGAAVKGLTAGTNITLTPGVNDTYTITSTGTAYTAGSGISITGTSIASSLGASLETGEITDGTIANADISGTAAIDYSKLNLLDAIVNEDIDAGASIAYGKLDLGGSVIGADITDGTITTSDISGTAAIGLSKLASGTSGQIIVANGTGVPSYVGLSGDATIATTGALTIAGSAVGAAEITDASITTSDISATAAITDAQLNNDLTISGGTINNSAIGATTASTGNFSNFTVNGAARSVYALQQLPRTNVTTTVDNPTDTDVGQYTSITIGTDGFPVVSYYDATNFDLKIAKCSNAACSASTLTTVDSAGDVGQYTSITIGTDGFPVISYYDSFNTSLKVIKCSNAACSGTPTANTTTTVDNAADVGQYSSITIGTDGFPVVSYYDATTFDLKIAKCSNAACSASTLTAVDSSGDVGRYTSITIGTNGFPAISYYDVLGFDLEISQCANAACSSSTLTTVDDVGDIEDVGRYTSITIGTDGFPVISYYDVTNGNLKIAKCSNAACFPSTLATVDSTGDVGAYSSITIGTDGFPVISYYDASGTNPKIAKCSNAACSASTLTTVDSTGDVGQDSSITIGTDGFPVVSYYDNTNDDLKVIKAANPFFVNNWTRR